MIPVIGTAVLKNPHWVERLYKSVDFPTENFIIINNNGTGEITEELERLKNINHPYVKKLFICHLPDNIGVASAWNLIIKSYILSPYWIIVNDDVAFTEGLLEKMHIATFDEEVGLVHGYRGEFDLGAWDLFLIKDWVIRDYGLFDENLYPAYCEDVDYVLKTANRVKKCFLDTNYYHGGGWAYEYDLHGSNNKRTSEELWFNLSKSNDLNGMYMTRKWGPHWPQVQRWDKPFLPEERDLKMNSFDLEFVRSKYFKV